MSTEKKRDRSLQHRVRERQAKTGESYQAAWRSLAGSDTVVPSNNFKVPRRRVPLPLSTSIKIPPGQSAQITARPQLYAFWPDRLLIKNADRWDIHQLKVGGWHKVAENDPCVDPSKLRFEIPLINVKGSSCNASAFSLGAWRALLSREVCCGQEVVTVVTYTGPSEEGERFEASLFGWEDQPPKKAAKFDVGGDSERVSERAESKGASTNERIKLPLIVKAPALFVDHLTIAEAEDWIVNDVRVRDKSIYVQSGDLPGVMFSDFEPVILEPLATNDCVEIEATYVGNSPSAQLVVDLSGTRSSSGTPREISYFLPLSTGVPILPSQSAQITARVYRNFLAERLVIASPSDWICNDITIGTRRQLAACGDIPGQAFASRAVGSHITLDPVRAGLDFILVTTRDEDCKEGAHFICGVQGHLI